MAAGSVIRSVLQPVLRQSVRQNLWSSSWITRLYDQEDLSFWTKADTRNGLVLPNSLSVGTGDAAILVPTARLATNAFIYRNEYIVGGAAWDVTIRFKVDSGAGNNPLINCGGYTGNVKGLMLRCNSGAINVFTANGTTSVSSNFAHNIANNTWYTLRFQWSGVEGEVMTVTVNGSSLTATTNKAWVGNSTDTISLGRYSTIYMTGNISSIVGIMSGRTINLYPTGIVSADNFEIGSDDVKWLVAGAGYVSQFLGGDTWFLDKGYSIWRDYLTLRLTYIPNTSNGLTTAGTSLTPAYRLLTEVSGTLTNHNLWNSKIRFSQDYFDRSNATIWNDACRASAYYDSGNVKDFHISEINELTIRTYLNDGYRAKFFPKVLGNSIDDRITLTDLILYTTDKKGIGDKYVLQYTRDIFRAQKDTSRQHYEDADGYIQLYLYVDLGNDEDYWHTYFQSRLATGNVEIPGPATDVYLIKQPLIVPDGRTLTVNGELRIKKGVTVNITSDVAINDTVINVDSVVGFNVGDQVSISDDLQTLMYYGTRRQASSGVITEIGESTITLDDGSRYAITTASNAKLGHTQSCIVTNGGSGISVIGSGIVNGNWAYQYDVEPVSKSINMEDVRQFCGISFHDTQSPSVSGVTVKNAGLHGISIGGMSTISGVVVQNITAKENHDKNILLRATDGAILNNITAEDSVFEDGLTLYAGNVNFIITNVFVNGNPRWGVVILNNGECNGSISTIQSTDGIAVWSSDAEINDVTFTDDGYISIQDVYTYGNDLVFNNITYNNVSRDSLISILGGCDRITFNELVFNDTTSSSAAILVDDRSGGGDFPQDILIDGGGFYNHTGTKASIDASADVVFADFDNYP